VTPLDRQDPRAQRVSAARQQEIRTQLGEEIPKAEPILLGYLKGHGLAGDLAVPFMVAARSIRAHRMEPHRLREEAFRLSRLLQSRSILWPEAQVAVILGNAVALSNPAVQAAAALFNGHLTDVQDNERGSSCDGPCGPERSSN
jgi:hypothetical protein